MRPSDTLGYLYGFTWNCPCLPKRSAHFWTMKESYCRRKPMQSEYVVSQNFVPMTHRAMKLILAKQNSPRLVSNFPGSCERVSDYCRRLVVDKRRSGMRGGSSCFREEGCRAKEGIAGPLPGTQERSTVPELSMAVPKIRGPFLGAHVPRIIVFFGAPYFWKHPNREVPGCCVSLSPEYDLHVPLNRAVPVLGSSVALLNQYNNRPHGTCYGLPWELRRDTSWSY